MPSMPEVTSCRRRLDVGSAGRRNPGAAATLPAPSATPCDARSLDERAGRGVAIDEQLHFRRAGAGHDHAPHDAGRRQHRHVGPQSVGRALADGDRAEFRRGRPGQDVGGRRLRSSVRVLQVEQLRSSSLRLRQRALLLQTDARAPQLALRAARSAARTPRRSDVAVPDDRCRRERASARALDLRDEAEGDRLQQRHARLDVTCAEISTMWTTTTTTNRNVLPAPARGAP